jgi:NADH dehydrogenase (ubiquinone) Fe-S protein 2
MLLNMGPCHPSCHGVLRVIGCFNAEILEYSYTEIGLLHRGTEKLIDSLGSYYTTLEYFDRLDYVSVATMELLFVESVERYINCYIYLYESLVRCILVELYRILNHALAITTHAIDIGLFTTMLLFFEEREKIYCLLELLTGSRFHLAFLYIGRNRYDLSLFFIEALFQFLLNFVRRLVELFNILSYNNI